MWCSINLYCFYGLLVPTNSCFLSFCPYISWISSILTKRGPHRILYFSTFENNVLIYRRYFSLIYFKLVLSIGVIHWKIQLQKLMRKCFLLTMDGPLEKLWLQECMPFRQRHSCWVNWMKMVSFMLLHIF